MRFATQQRILVDLGKGFFIADDAFQMLCGELRTLFDQSPSRSVAEIRDQWKITRKHAIPLLEYCDSMGITQRNGDAREAGPALDKMFAHSESHSETSLEGDTIEQD